MVFNRKHVLIVSGVFCLGLAVSALGFFLAYSAEENYMRLDFVQRSMHRAHDIQVRLNDNLEMLEAVESFYDASNVVERVEFEAFTNRLLSKYPDIQSIDWIARVPREQREIFEQKIRGEGLADFQVTEMDISGPLVRAKDRPEYFPLTYIEPLSVNKAVLGFDEASDMVRREALERARDTDSPVATGSLDLIQTEGRNAGCRIFMPVYRERMSVKTLEDRRKNLIGFISSLFDVGVLVRKSIEGTPRISVDTYLYDVTGQKESGDLLYFHSARTRIEKLSAPRQSDLYRGISWSEELNMAGRTWRIVCRPAPKFFQEHRRWQSWTVLGSGLFLTILLVVYLTDQLGYAARIESLVNERTAELRRSEQLLAIEKDRLAITLQSIGDGVIATDTQGRITLMNRVAQMLTGWNGTEAVGKPLDEVFHILDEETRKLRENPFVRVMQTGRVVGLGSHTVLVARDGTERILGDSGAPIRDPNGNIIGVVLVFRDITQIRRLEDMRREELRFLQVMMDAIPNPVFYKDIQGKFLGCNAAFEEFLGLPKNQIVGKTVFDLSPPDLARIYADSDAELLKNPGAQVFETIVKRADDVRRDVIMSKATFSDIKGNLKGMAGVIVDITDRKLMEEQLRSSEEKYHRLIEQLSEGILSVDMEARITFVNQGMAHMLGYQTKDMLDMSYYSLVAPDFVEFAKARIQKRHEGVSEQYEIPMVRKDGKTLDVLVSASPLRDKSGAILGSFGVISDISERKHAEEAMRQLAAIVESSNDAIIGKTLEGIITSWNAGAQRLFGYSPEEAIGRHMDILLPDNRSDEIRHFLEKIKRGERLEHIETVRKTKDGRLIDVLLTVSPIKDSDGRVIGASAISHDITERKRTEEKLRHLSRAIEQSPSTVAITDLEGNLQYVNPKFVQVTGYVPEEVLGKNPRVLKSGEISSAGYKELWDVICDGGEWRGEFHNKRKNGELYWEFASISPIRNAEGKITHYIKVAEDITDRKNAEEQLRHTSEKLAESNRELEQFAYVASHDLQEPLRKISAFSKLLTEKDISGLDEESRDYLERMQNAAARMRLLIEDLLQYSRVATQQRVLEEIALNRLVAAVLSDLEMRIRDSNAEVVVGDLPVIHGDRTRLHQLFQNVIGNALKYRRKDVPVRVLIQSRILNDRFYEITVEDNGIGFEEKYSERIFHPFQRLHTRDEYEGSGIGLAICKKIMDQLGGQISARSEAGKGSVFILKLPKS